MRKREEGAAVRLRKTKKRKQRRRISIRWMFWGMLLVFTVLGFNAYVDAEIRPTLMQLAEYEARAVVLQTMHQAVNETMEQWEADCAAIYLETADGLQMNAVAANRVRSKLIQAVQERMEALPERKYYIPFGSLTGNSLLNGHGPGWEVNLQPEGYVQGQWQEHTESLSINTTRCSADLLLSVTVNMILDGRTETITVTDSLPMASVVLCGDMPDVYAAALD